MIENLKIYSTNGDIKNLLITKLIRNISFKKGLNLIVDSDDVVGAGNDIGKTTFINLIDLCLGAKDIDIIYSDKETKTSKNNTNIVQKFIEDKKITIELNLLGNQIIRPLFKTKPQNIFFLNKKQTQIDEIKKFLCSLLFGVDCKYISFRKLLAKFVRNNKESMNNIIDYLSSFTREDEYKAVRLLLFGYDNIKQTKELSDLKAKQREYTKLKTYYINNTTYNEKELEQLINMETYRINDFNQRLNKLDTSKGIIDIIKGENNNKSELRELIETYSYINFKIKKFNDSIATLNANISVIDTNVLEQIYKETLIYIPQLQKNFSDLVQIHNKTIDNEKRFIQSNLDSLEKQKIQIEYDIKKLSEEKVSAELIKEINYLSEQLSESNKKLGEYNERKKQLDEIVEKINIVNNKITSISSTIEIGLKSFNENISYFNQIFHKFQEEVYGGASRFIYYDSESGFKLSTDKSKSGSGQKKGEVILFDLAYNKLTIDKNIKSPRFIIHDQLELTDIGPKEEVFVNILPRLECQFIVPSIRSSLIALGDNFIRENTILELSKTNKLFRIEEYDNIEDEKTINL